MDSKESQILKKENIYLYNLRRKKNYLASQSNFFQFNVFYSIVGRDDSEAFCIVTSNLIKIGPDPTSNHYSTPDHLGRALRCLGDQPDKNNALFELSPCPKAGGDDNQN